MFWADRHAEAILGHLKGKGPLFVRDEKTLSGRVHIGSMRGVAIHGLITEALQERGADATFHYELNDFDVMDGIPAELDEKEWSQYLGLPLNKVPSPDGIAANFAEYYGQEFQNVISEAGFTPTYYKNSELYTSGRMNEAIRLILEHAETVRRIYKEVSGSEKKDDWLPISMVCMQCGKIGTTQAYDFDGEHVSYRCTKGPGGAVGCGHEGKSSPYDGSAKLPWKPEWPAKWLALGVQVEGAGKDHSTKGGARDVANAIAREVFKIEPPYDIPYEFFLDAAGKKMSSSKGRGTSSREIASNFPKTIFRLALLGKEPQVQTSIDPQGELLATLYDWHDRIAEKYWSDAGDDEARLFALLYHGNPPSRMYLPRFSVVAFIAQMAHLDPVKEFGTLKGVPLVGPEIDELSERIEYTKRWLEHYAPEKYKFEVQKSLPEVARTLTDVQKKALGAVLAYVEGQGTLDGAALHGELHRIKEEVGIQPKDLFTALYRAFLGRDSGPQAGWLLSTLEKDFLVARLREVLA